MAIAKFHQNSDQISPQILKIGICQVDPKALDRELDEIRSTAGMDECKNFGKFYKFYGFDGSTSFDTAQDKPLTVKDNKI